MTRDKAHLFQMRVSSDWLVQLDAWRRTQTDIPSRAEAIRRLVSMGLRFEIKIGDEVSTPAGQATVQDVKRAIGMIEVATKNGDGHLFSLSEISTVSDQD